jgi:hypothetical protein
VAGGTIYSPQSAERSGRIAAVEYTDSYERESRYGGAASCIYMSTVQAPLAVLYHKRQSVCRPTNIHGVTPYKT